MHILQTQRQIVRNEHPIKLEILRELNKRDALNEDLLSEWQRLESGFAGEQKVLNFIQEFGEEHWAVIKNVWLDYYGKFECDLLLITNTKVHPLEIKNYTGKFEFQNNQCLINGKKISHNAITQAQKTATNLEQIFQNSNHNLTVQGALIFIGQHNEVLVHDKVDTIEIIRPNQLRNYIWELVKEEKNYYGPSIDTESVIEQLERFEADNPFMGHEISDEIKGRACKGICCSHCGNFQIDTTKAYISCPCGMYEPRENAIVRTICEYGVIHSDKDLRTTNLLGFFGGDISRRTLQKYLNKHFTKTGGGRGSRFLNFKLPFNKIQYLFNLKKQRYLKI